MGGGLRRLPTAAPRHCPSTFQSSFLCSISSWTPVYRWEMVEAGAGALELFGASLPANTSGPALVRRVLDRAAANGFTVLRTWAHTVTAQYALQVLSLLGSEWWLETTCCCLATLRSALLCYPAHPSCRFAAHARALIAGCCCVCMPPTPLLYTILQTSPGEYNESVFKGLDYVLDEARKRGIRVSSRTGLAGVPPAAGCVPLLSAALCLMWVRRITHQHA